MKMTTPTARRLLQYFVQYREIPTKTALKVSTSTTYQSARKEVLQYLWSLIPDDVKKENL